MSSWLLAFALMLVFEGLLPLVAPTAWRDTFKRLIALRDGQIRFLGLTLVVAGLILSMVF